MKECLVVVDYQVDFVSGSLGFEGAECLDEKIFSEIETVRARGGDVIFTFDTHMPDYLETSEGKKLPVPHCIKGSAGHALYGKTATALREGDRCFEKPTFGSVALAEYLSGEGYDTITLVGLVSHICVLTNALLIKSFLPDATVSVIAGLTDAADKDLHRAALAVLKSVQVEIK